MRHQPGKQDFNGLPAVLAEYLLRMDRGEPVNREAFLAEYPQHAEALHDYFADVDLIERFTATPGASSVAATVTPREFGQYDLLSEIGRGGMGIVYQAREQSTDRLIALKMLLHGAFPSSAELRRFHNEARATAALRHPGIVPIYYVGEHQGHLFYTMPLIRGANLAKRLAGPPLEPRFAAKLLLAIAEAVHYAHSHGVVHRDLKPANILLDEHDRPYVADFGLARRLEEEPFGITATGDLLGTPNYMAPEQVNGRHATVGAPADIYALGAVLYALVVGQPPFQSGSISDTLHRICSVDPVRPRQIRREVPRDLETICLKCLEKSPICRYHSASDLANDLQRFLAGEPLFAQQISRVERCRRWFARNPVVGTLTMGIALALITGAGFSTFYAAKARQRAEQALANLYAADMNLAQQHLRSGAVANAVQLLERHRPKRSATERPSWEWRHLWQQCHGELRRFEGPHGPVYVAAFSPGGRTIAAAGADQMVWLWDTASGKRTLKLEGHTGTVRDLVFAPDGQHLVTVADDGRARIWDASSGQLVATLAGHEQPLTTVAFSASGQFIATGGNNEARVNLWHATNGKLLQSLDQGPAESLAFAPGDEYFAIAGRDGFVRIIRVDDAGAWTRVTSIRAHDHIVRDLAWSPDGTRLATGGADRAVKIWDVHSWRELSAIRPFKESVYSISFSPDGRRLVIAARNEPLKVWDFDQQQFIAELLGHTALVTSIDYCPDGWRVVSASEDGSVRLWDAVQTADHVRLDGHLGQVRTVAFSPHGSILASGGSQDGAIILWDSETCLPKGVLRTPACSISDLAFNPDGKSLASVHSIGAYEDRLRFWDIDTKTATLDVNLAAGPLVSIAWSPDGDRLAVKADNGSIRLIEANTGKILESAPASDGTGGNVVFSPDGKLVVTTTGGDASVRIWQSDTLSPLLDLRGHTAPAVSAAFNPKGAFIASSSNDHTIRLWEAVTWQHVRTFAGHGGTPLALAFSPDGTRLASGSTDQTVKIWNVETGLELQSLVGHTDWARDVAFSPDAQQLASAGYDGIVRIWHAPHKAADPVGGVSVVDGDPAVGGVSDADGKSASREANALVHHLATGMTTRDSLVARIESDQTINNYVRDAAIRQAGELLLYWHPMLEGHRAAERGDWVAAIDAFRRVCDLAPDDAMHWHWLAMASLAAGQHETYHQACDELLRRNGADARENELFWTLRAWLVSPRNENELAPLAPLLEAYIRYFGNAQSVPWLYRIRRGQLDSSAPDATGALPTLGPLPDDCYVAAMVWLKLGNPARALSAYKTATRLARAADTVSVKWEGQVHGEMLRREAEGMLAGETSLEVDPAARAPAGSAFTPDERSIRKRPDSASDSAKR